MEKVIVSKRMAQLIRNTKKFMSNQEIISRHQEIGAIQRGDIDIFTLRRALHEGYEIKE